MDTFVYSYLTYFEVDYYYQYGYWIVLKSSIVKNISSSCSISCLPYNIACKL